MPCMRARTLGLDLLKVGHVFFNYYLYNTKIDSLFFVKFCLYPCCFTLGSRKQELDEALVDMVVKDRHVHNVLFHCFYSTCNLISSGLKSHGGAEIPKGQGQKLLVESKGFIKP